MIYKFLHSRTRGMTLCKKLQSKRGIRYKESHHTTKHPEKLFAVCHNVKNVSVYRIV